LLLGGGIGEASCAPADISLIGDLVPAERRARALGLFMIGLPLGLALSFVVSATVAQHYSWQNAFFVAGVPGLALAVAALFIADPREVDGGRWTVDGEEHQTRSTVHRPPSTVHLPPSTVLGRMLGVPTMLW